FHVTGVQTCALPICRHESGDPTAWIRQAASDPSLPADRPRIVLAHGTIQGFGSTQEDEDEGPSVANWINLSGLPDGDIDYIALRSEERRVGKVTRCR